MPNGTPVLVTAQEIKEAIKDLRNKSVGDDGISVFLLKFCPEHLAEPITRIKFFIFARHFSR